MKQQRALNPQHVEIVKNAISTAPYMAYLGMRATKLDVGICTLEVELNPNHLHAYGSIHGGVYASVIDTVCYWAAYCAMEEDDGFLSADLNVTNLSSITKGKLFVEGRVIKQGKTMTLTEGEVRDEGGRLLAHGTSKLLVHPKLLSAKEGLSVHGIHDLPPKFL